MEVGHPLVLGSDGRPAPLDPPLAERLPGERGELALGGDPQRLLVEPLDDRVVQGDVGQTGDAAPDLREDPVVGEDPVAPVGRGEPRHLFVHVLPAGGVVHLGEGDPRGTGLVTAHTVRAVGDRVVDRVLAVVLLEAPLLWPLELRPREVVVDLGDRTARVAARTLVTGVRAGPEVRGALRARLVVFVARFGEDLHRELVVAGVGTGGVGARVVGSVCVAHGRVLAASVPAAWPVAIETPAPERSAAKS